MRSGPIVGVSVGLRVTSAYGGHCPLILSMRVVGWVSRPCMRCVGLSINAYTISHPLQPGKRHPRDWENPGRVKVCFKTDSRFQNPLLKTSAYRFTTMFFFSSSDINSPLEKQLLEAIARLIQQQHPDLVPRPSIESTDTSTQPPSTPHPTPGSDIKPSSSKKDKAKTSSSNLRTAPIRKTMSKLPQPPPGVIRVSQLSPAQEANILIETVKAGMNAPVPGEGPPGGMAGMGGGKGKRKVLRVR